jgi:hypothetical protein
MQKAQALLPWIIFGEKDDPYPENDTKGYLRRVHLNWDSHLWCKTCMREGDHYIGGCCGTSGAMQDIINSVFRDGGELNMDTLESLAGYGISHDGKDSLWGEGALPVEPPTDPWDQLALTWRVLREFADTKRGKHGYDRRKPRYPLEEELHALSKYAFHYTWRCLMKDNATNEGRIRLYAARLYPSMRTLLNHFAEGLGLEPVDLWAVWYKDRIHHDFMFYATEKEALDDINDSRRRRQDNAEILAQLDSMRVRPVRVSLDEGIRFLDDGTLYDQTLMSIPLEDDADNDEGE